MSRQGCKCWDEVLWLKLEVKYLLFIVGSMDVGVK